MFVFLSTSELMCTMNLQQVTILFGGTRQTNFTPNFHFLSSFPSFIFHKKNKITIYNANLIYDMRLHWNPLYITIYVQYGAPHTHISYNIKLSNERRKKNEQTKPHFHSVHWIFFFQQIMRSFEESHCYVTLFHIM